jgi:hypothetical protein
LKDYLKGQEMLKQVGHNALVFRPAYGKIKKSQISNPKSPISIVNWTLMPGDFDQHITSEQCYSNLQRVQPGDIVVLHDSEQAWIHLEYCLPKFLEYCKENNFSLNKIDL